MFLQGIKPPPLGSIQDGVLRTVFTKQRVRKLRELSLTILSQGSGEENVRKLNSLYKEHVNEVLYQDEFEKRTEEDWRKEYANMQKSLVSLTADNDGKLTVKGLDQDGSV